jgi:hypothetical protein
LIQAVASFPVSTESRTFESCGPLAGVLPRILEHEPGELESIGGSRARERNGGTPETRRRKTTEED